MSQHAQEMLVTLQITLQELRDQFKSRPEDAIFLRQAYLRTKVGKEGTITAVEPRKMSVQGPLLTVMASGRTIKVNWESVDKIECDELIDDHLKLRRAIDERILAERMRMEQRSQVRQEQRRIEQGMAAERRKKSEETAIQHRRKVEEEQGRLREAAEVENKAHALRAAKISEHKLLFERFDIEIDGEFDPCGELIDILSRIENGSVVSDEELQWLRARGLGVVVGHYYFRTYVSRRVRSLVPKACREWREARRQDLTIDLVLPYVEGDKTSSLAQDHAVLNNIATAFYDYRQYDDARQFAERSIGLRPKDDPNIYMAYCLLVLICDGLEDADGVSEYRRLAVENSPNQEGCSKPGRHTRPKHMPKSHRVRVAKESAP